MVFTPSFVTAQGYILSTTSVNERKAISQNSLPDAGKVYAEELAMRLGLPVRKQYSDGTIIEIMKINSNGLPVYYKTYNLNAARTISTDRVWTGGGLGLDLDGSGIVVGLWDGGPIRSTHVEFEGRVRLIDEVSIAASHATHVAGTIAAAGLRADAHGMANKCTVDGYNWDLDNVEMRIAAQQGMLISNHSYGFIHGWEYNQDLKRWEWYGDVSISQKEDYNFGFYGEEAKMWDEIAYDNPKYLIVKSAGNDRDQGPPEGSSHYVWIGNKWVRSTTIRKKDGNNGFDCIGTQGTSKNILTVGAANDIPSGYKEPSDVKIASFSAFGPTDDGRIKPDIIGNGISLLSTGSDSDNSYFLSSGTSMSSPNIAGSLALLQEHYQHLHGSYMFSSLLKALVLHTADDAGNPGPDYKYGWGLMNTASAAELISSDQGENLQTDTLKSMVKKKYTLYNSGLEDIKITIAWTDPAGSLTKPQLDPTNAKLVNDLDIKLYRLADGHAYNPYTLDPSDPDKPASHGDNRTDNVEQISIKTPQEGFYELEVSNKDFLISGQQSYSLVISGLTKEYIANGEILLNEVNGEIVLSTAKKYTNNMDVKWLIQPGNGKPVSLYFDYFITEMNADVLRIYDGTQETDPLIGIFSGSMLDSDTILSSTGSAMLLHFTSNEAATQSGFYGRYCTEAPVDPYLIEGNAYPCINSLVTYKALGQKGTEYNWDLEKAWKFSTIQNSQIILNIGVSENTIKVMPFNRCGNGNLFDRVLQPQDSVPEINFIEGDTMPCLGSTNEYFTNESNGTTYSWKIPSSWMGSSDSSKISLLAGNKSGYILVNTKNACGSGNSVSIFVDVTDQPEAELVQTDKIPPCAGSVQPFFVKNDPDVSYTWNVGSDWEILSGESSDTVLLKVGTKSDYVKLLASNKCGTTVSDRLFLTAPLPDAPMMEKQLNDFGNPVLNVINEADIEAIQWYLNGIPIDGERGVKKSIIATRNGIYTAASISKQACVNKLGEEEGIEIDLDKFTFIAYRMNESTIVIENTLNSVVGIRIISSYGRVVYIGSVQPGYNEINHSDKGIFLIQYLGFGDSYITKSVF